MYINLGLSEIVTYQRSGSERVIVANSCIPVSFTHRAWLYDDRRISNYIGTCNHPDIDGESYFKRFLKWNWAIPTQYHLIEWKRSFQCGPMWVVFEYRHWTFGMEIFSMPCMTIKILMEALHTSEMYWVFWEIYHA